MRLHATRRAAIAQGRGLGNPLWDLAGVPASLDHRFAESKSLVDAVSGQNLITFTRASDGAVVNSAGQIEIVAANVPRFDHNPVTGESLGLLGEEQRTNSIRNNTMVGAVAGTPGTLPTNWAYAVAGPGITREIVGTGVENGINYIDFRFSGTTGSTTPATFGIDRGAASAGQSWAGSLYWKLVAGSTSNITSWNIGLIEETSSFAFVVGANYPQPPPTSIFSRVTASRTLSGGATVASCLMTIPIVSPSGVAIDFTLRIGLPQLEQGAFATSVIPTSGTAVTRSADVASITGDNFSRWYRQDEGTLFTDTVNREAYPGSNVFPYILQIDDGTNNNRISYDNSVLSSGYRYNLACHSGGVSQDELNQFGFASGAARWASAFRTNDFALAINLSPSVVSTRTSGTLPNAMTQMQIGAGFGKKYTGTIRRLTYWPTRLSNSTLQNITL